MLTKCPYTVLIVNILSFFPSFFLSFVGVFLLKPDFIPREDILSELKEIETKLNELEKKGVDLERQLRQCEEGESRHDV